MGRKREGGRNGEEGSGRKADGVLTCVGGHLPVTSPNQPWRRNLCCTQALAQLALRKGTLGRTQLAG